MEFELLLPVAGITINPFIIWGLGLAGGFLSGMLGVGGGVIITPTLIFMGIPPIVAVASQVNNSIGTCFVGFMGYRRNDDVDANLGSFLLTGGFFGSIIGVLALKWLHDNGHAGWILSIGYIVILGLMGSILMRQSLKSLARYKKQIPSVSKTPQWVNGAPFHKYFKRTRVELSVIFPFLTGVINGLLTAAMGTGNGVFMMPAITYLIGRTSPVVYGTTLLAGLAITITVTLIFALNTQSIDLTLVFLLFAGGGLGSQLGVRFGYKIPRPYLGIVGSLLILLLGFEFLWVLQASWGTLEAPLHGPSTSLNSHFSAYPSFIYDYPILVAIVGILGVLFVSTCIEYLFSRFSLIFQSSKG